MMSFTSHLVRRSASRLLFNGQLQYNKRFYEIEASELKRGVMIEHKGKLLETIKTEHQKVAMRGGFILADFRNALDGTKSNYKFRSAETLEAIDLERTFYKFTEKTKEGLVFKSVDDEDAEPVVVKDAKQLGVYSHYIEYFPQDETQYSFLEYNGKVLDFRGPTEVKMHVDSISDLSNNLVLHFANGRSCKAPSHLTKGCDIMLRLPEETYVTKA
ncbi:hypothetical protein PPL_02472 [Heterostelium album PN500]|uniref:Translation elongation factor KOW-like domain-containing protein n=1 Tax=Heterostelium pallidum (strain ATCC 26659 / Pp 5 / PN500) TaxID=670386 RepID=D3B265_HETP5|nr:hypothetical protein PPL_02472 [Heterostelium album PN500]EFA84440.1 hypothetical protein PPL_02472 [Heterostelium album PN500]|eukprot:XP_020436554.1 hypothetical protein PPL_02472 [Heterostelium album PN500]